MRTYTAVIEKCPDTGLFVGYIPGLRGAHSQGVESWMNSIITSKR